MESAWDATERQRARENEERFARANAEIGEKAVELAVERVPFLCECSDLDCVGVVPLTLADYRAAKARDSVFVLLRGHNDPRMERVVEERDGFIIVEKEPT